MTRAASKRTTDVFSLGDEVVVDSRTAPSRDVAVNSDCGRLAAVTAGPLLLGRVRRSHVSALTPTAAPIDAQGLAGRRRAAASEAPGRQTPTRPPSSSPGRQEGRRLRAGGAGRRRPGRARGPAVGWDARAPGPGRWASPGRRGRPFGLMERGVARYGVGRSSAAAGRSGARVSGVIQTMRCVDQARPRAAGVAAGIRLTASVRVELGPVPEGPVRFPGGLARSQGPRVAGPVPARSRDGDHQLAAVHGPQLSAYGRSLQHRGGDAPSAPARARSGRGAGYRTQGAAPADRRGQQVRVRDPRDRQGLGDGSRRLSRRTATGCQLIVMIADRTTLSIARNRAATWYAMLAMMGLPPGCAAAIAPRTVLVTTPNADNQRGGCVHQSDVA